MGDNIVRGYTDQRLTYVLDLGGAVVAGVPTAVNSLIALPIEATDANDMAECVLPGINVIVNVSVKGEDDSGDQAIAVGNKVYIDTDLELNFDAANGTFFGYALEAVSSGATTAIDVALAQS